MTSMVTRLTNRVKKWFLGFRIRKAKDITDSERETCERYGEQVIGAMLASGMYPGTGELRLIHESEAAKIHARDWLTERADIQARRDRWIPLRDLLLEIAVISLICWEIRLGYKQEAQQAESFSKQQQILQNLNDSSKATADTLISLKQTTDLELAAMKESTGLSERSAKASEASAVTSAKALHMSERAYLTTTIALSAPFKGGEKQNFTSTILNSGRTTAVEVKIRSRAVGAPKGITEEAAHTLAYSDLSEVFASKSILAAGQQLEQIVEAQKPLTDEQVSHIADGSMKIYAFVSVEYKDLFDHLHHTEVCSVYDPITKRLLICAAFNKAD
jgi:hypothetical protein